VKNNPLKYIDISGKSGSELKARKSNERLINITYSPTNWEQEIKQTIEQFYEATTPYLSMAIVEQLTGGDKDHVQYFLVMGLNQIS
jgi:hypothetical protein